MSRQTTASQKAANTGDSTHGSAAQASAARLLRLLRVAYPRIQTHSLTDAASPDHPQKMAQSSLSMYLNGLIKPEKSYSLSETERNNPDIAATLKMIDYISGNANFSDDQKKLVFTQMRSIAQTCPGFTWNSDHHLWSTNKIYNAKTKKSELVTASPAETLNLVCGAIFDEKRYVVASDSTFEKDTVDRVGALFGCLLELQNEVERGQLQKCSAGRQHDLLFLLNHNYLDKPCDQENTKAVELIEDANCFSLECLSSFLDEKIKKLPADQQAKLSRDWALYQTGLTENKASPVLDFLRQQHPGPENSVDAAWKLAGCNFLAKKFEEAGLNPHDYKLSETVSAIDDIDLPGATIAVLMKEILAVSDIPLSSIQLPINDLIAKRNAATAVFKAETRQQSLDQKDISAGIKDFYTALQCVDILYHYRHLTIFIGEGESQLNQAQQRFQEVLSLYFSDYKIGKPLPSHFETIKSAYIDHEKAIRGNLHSDFIENFFLHIAEPGAFQAHFARAKTFEQGIMLSDEALNQWFMNNARAEEGQNTLDLSSYEVNRILLNALLKKPSEWSPVFCNALGLVTQWLLTPEAPSDSISLKALKKSYPAHFLNNLLFGVSLKQNITMPSSVIEEYDHYFQVQTPTGVNLYDEKMAVLTYDVFFDMFQNSSRSSQQRTQILSAIQNRLGALIQHEYQLRGLLDCASFNDIQRTQILNAVPLSTLIQNGIELNSLLNCTKLNENHRTHILNAVPLSTMIQNGSELNILLKYAMLNDNHCRQILTAVQDRLSALIQDGYQLCNLLDCASLNDTQCTQILNEVPLGTLIRNEIQLDSLLNSPILNENQRGQIWSAVQDKLDTLIKDGEALSILLRNTTLNDTQRRQIWSAAENKLGTLIKNNYLLRSLLLECTTLSDAQRTQILNAVPLSKLIRDESQLSLLLNCTKLNENHHTHILNAVQDALDTIIQNRDQLSSLLNCSTLNENHRAQILHAVPLDVLIPNGVELNRLLDCTMLNENHCTQILNAVPLSRLIQNGTELHRLLNCATLNENHRRQIWSAVEYNLDTIIQNGGQLRALLVCTALDDIQRRQIWSAVEKQLGTIIKQEKHLRALLNCTALNDTQRTQIWSAVQDKLGTLIPNNDQLRTLLDHTSLNDTQRTRILNAVLQNSDQLYSWLESCNNNQYPLVWSAIESKLKIDIFYLPITDPTTGFLSAIRMCKLVDKSAFLSEHQKHDIFMAVQKNLKAVPNNANGIVAKKIAILCQLQAYIMSRVTNTGSVNLSGTFFGRSMPLSHRDEKTTTSKIENAKQLREIILAAAGNNEISTALVGSQQFNSALKKGVGDYGDCLAKCITISEGAPPATAPHQSAR